MSFYYSRLGESFSFGQKTPHLGGNNRSSPALTHAKPKTRAEKYTIQCKHQSSNRKHIQGLKKNHSENL